MAVLSAFFFFLMKRHVKSCSRKKKNLRMDSRMGEMQFTRAQSLRQAYTPQPTLEADPE
jgi:hypothetical protein